MSIKKIAFMAPATKGGPFFLYQELVLFLNNKYNGKLDITFCHTKKDRIALHFKRYDGIVSVIPFVFKPIRAKRFYINIHGNYKIERKNLTLGRSLLFLMEWNIFWSTNVIVNSSYLFETLKLPVTTKVIENFVIDKHTTDLDLGKNRILDEPIQLLTVSSSKFKEKAQGIVDLAVNLTELGRLGRQFQRTIVAGGNDEIYDTIKQQIASIDMPSCCTIRYLDRQTKDELKALYSESDIFIYGTRLDTWGLTVMEAMINKLPVILLPYAAWEHIYPEQFITTQLVKRIEFILMNYLQEADEAYTFAKQFSLEHIGKKRFTLLNTNDV